MVSLGHVLSRQRVKVAAGMLSTKLERPNTEVSISAVVVSRLMHRASNMTRIKSRYACVPQSAAPQAVLVHVMSSFFSSFSDFLNEVIIAPGGFGRIKAFPEILVPECALNGIPRIFEGGLHQLLF